MENKHKSLKLLLLILLVVVLGLVAYLLFYSKTDLNVSENYNIATTSKKKTPTAVITQTPQPTTQGGLASPEQPSKEAPVSISEKGIYYYKGTITNVIEQDKTVILQIATKDFLATVLDAYKREFSKVGWKIDSQIGDDKSGFKLTIVGTIANLTVVIGSDKEATNIVQQIEYK